MALDLWTSRSRWQPLRPLFEMFVRYPLLGLLLVLVIAVDWGAGMALGLPTLFLGEGVWRQALAGVSQALLFIEICFVGFLLDADESWPHPGGHGTPTVRWYLLETLTLPLVAVLVVLPIALGHRWLTPGLYPSAWAQRPWAFVVGFLGILVLLLVGLRRGAAARGERPPAGALTQLIVDRRKTSIPRLHLLQAALFLALVLLWSALAFCATSPRLRGYVAPGVVLCVVLAVVAAVYGAVHFYFPRRHFGALVLLVLGVIGVTMAFSRSGSFDLGSTGRPPVYSNDDLASVEEARLVSDLDALRSWHAAGSSATCGSVDAGTDLCSGARIPLIVVASSGGGIRAAAWTAAVLSELDAIPGFRRHTRILTGASGGMVGAAAWLTSIREPDRFDLWNGVSTESLSAIARAVLLPFTLDRGRSLERSWEEHTNDALATPLRALAQEEARGEIPSLVFSPMIVEDGRRLVISNLDLQHLIRVAIVDDGLATLSGVQLFRLYPDAELKISTAARMSASFPYVSPAGTLETTDGGLRVVDAGYYDNYGVDLAAMWIHHHRDFIRQCTCGVALVQIRDSLGRVRTELGAHDPPSSWLAWIQWLSTPPEGLLAARESSMSFRNDELLAILRQDLGEKFTTVILELSAAAPLSWALTEPDKKLISEDVTKSANASQTKRLSDWFATLGTPESAREVPVAAPGELAH